MTTYLVDRKCHQFDVLHLARVHGLPGLHGLAGVLHLSGGGAALGGLAGVHHLTRLLGLVGVLGLTRWNLIRHCRLLVVAFLSLVALGVLLRSNSCQLPMLKD